MGLKKILNFIAGKKVGAIIDLIPIASPIKSLAKGLIGIFKLKKVTMKVKIFRLLKQILKAVLPIIRKNSKVEDWVILLLEIALAIVIVLA